MTNKSKLYYSTVCPFAQRAMIVAKHKGFQGEWVAIDLSKDLPEYYLKDVNPKGEVPAFQLPNGTCLSESLPIAQYLDDVLEPRNSLFSPNAEVRRKIRNFVAAFEPGMWSLYSVLTAKPDEMEAKIDDCVKAFEKVMPLMSSTSDFAVGSTFSMADVLTVPFIIRFSYTLRAYCGFDITARFPRLAAFRDQCLAVPAVASTTPAPEFFISGYTSYAGEKLPNWKYHLLKANGCPFSERVDLTWAMITAGPKAPEFMKGKHDLYYSETIVTDLSTVSDVPVLTIPTTGEAISSSVGAATYLAELFPEAGLIPHSAEDIYTGRWIADACGNITDEIIGHLLAHCKDFELTEDVTRELVRVEKLFANAGKGGKKLFMFGDEPSVFDLIVLPIFHRAEILLGAKLAAVAPSIVGAVKAARADAVLGAKLVSAEDYFKLSERKE